MLTIDVEDWFQVENLRPACPCSTWAAQELRVESSVRKLLELFERFDVQATFFFLGWIAERLPRLVQEVAVQGHEVASHGQNHVLCSAMPAKELLLDLQRSKAVLEDLVGRPVLGYRAPSFSISDQAADLLFECGYKYDSSFNSLRFNKRYGKLELSGQQRGLAHVLKSGIVELPLSNLKIGPWTIPLAGGGYFRFWPACFFHWGVKKILNKEPGYIFYCHPWEFDPQQPKVSSLGWLSGFRHYLNLEKSMSRLERLLTGFSNQVQFMSCAAYLQDMELL